MVGCMTATTMIGPPGEGFGELGVTSGVLR
jgi:hypothetical protein